MSENLPVNVTIDEGVGSVTFANDVIATIAGLAATEIEGVAGMTGNVMTDLGEILGRRSLTKGVKAEVGKEEVAIDVYAIIYYGSPIIEVCKRVQENVRKAIETMTGLRAVEVNVHVQGIQFEKELPAPVAEEEPPQPPRVH
ncbi:MAG: Asp23/Gls24 family envelope stress response protein [Christensenellaceae bacterium]|jgi:uncharacterized alkaline shock family protein YloU|nr:Asp23/Gls24 family envelope stress response protein [Christensenellaceae bacterium]